MRFYLSESVERPPIRKFSHFRLDNIYDFEKICNFSNFDFSKQKKIFLNLDFHILTSSQRIINLQKKQSALKTFLNIKFDVTIWAYA